MQAGGRMPKSRQCYICGRQYGTHSFDIHLKQCQKLWEARENLKEPGQRKPIPKNPFENGGFPGTKESESGIKSQKGLNSGQDGGLNVKTDNKVQQNGMSLEEMNRIASEIYNNNALERCEFCNRTFLPEKLVIHHKSCTADKPARKITDPVNRRAAVQPDVSRSIDELGVNKMRDKNRQDRSDSLDEDARRPATQPQLPRSRSPAKARGAPLVGHLGGLSGRDIRGGNDNHDVKMSSATDSVSPGKPSLPPIGARAAIAAVADVSSSADDVLDRLDYLEEMAQQFLAEIRTIRRVVRKSQSSN